MHKDITELLDYWQDLTLCELAQAYARCGLHVFPLAPREKRPMAGSRGFKDATVDPEQIAAWWDQYPDMNIGIATGAVSGILVIDVDAQHGGLATMESIRDLLPPTLTAITGSGGRHIIYTIPAGVLIRSANARWPGIDVKADGGYIVAPGSVHPNGTQYAWHGGAPSQLPHELARTLLQARANDRARNRSIIKSGKIHIDTLPFVKANNRNDFFCSLAGMLRVRGYELNAAIALCHEVNAQKVEQGKGWSAREMEGIVRRNYRLYGDKFTGN